MYKFTLKMCNTVMLNLFQYLKNKAIANFFFYTILGLCGSNSMARVPAFQAGCCEFESRLPLIKRTHLLVGLFNWLI